MVEEKVKANDIGIRERELLLKRNKDWLLRYNRKILLHPDYPPEDILDVVLRLILLMEATYTTKGFTHTPEKRMRSTEDIFVCARCYFPETTIEQIVGYIKILQKLKVSKTHGLYLINTGYSSLINTGYCGNIRKIRHSLNGTFWKVALNKEHLQIIKKYVLNPPDDFKIPEDELSL
jgi:hypothetical protein